MHVFKYVLHILCVYNSPELKIGALKQVLLSQPFHPHNIVVFRCTKLLQTSFELYPLHDVGSFTHPLPVGLSVQISKYFLHSSSVFIV